MAVQSKIVGASGQISIGKQYAGQQVIIEEIEPGEWRIQTAITIPKSQAWVHTQAVQAALADALDWAANAAPKKTPLTNLAKLKEAPRAAAKKVSSGRRK